MEELLRVIDRLIPLNDIKTKSAEEILDLVVTRIYDKDNLHITETETFYKLPEIIRDIILLINFDTEVTMQGILGFLENSTGLYFKDTIQSFEKVKAKDDYKILCKIDSVIEKYNVSTTDLRKSVSNQELYGISNFAELHGTDSEEMVEEIIFLADELYVSHEERNVFDHLIEYIDQKRDLLIKELKL